MCVQGSRGRMPASAQQDARAPSHRAADVLGVSTGARASTHTRQSTLVHTCLEALLEQLPRLVTAATDARGTAPRAKRLGAWTRAKRAVSTALWALGALRSARGLPERGETLVNVRAQVVRTLMQLLELQGELGVAFNATDVRSLRLSTDGTGHTITTCTSGTLHGAMGAVLNATDVCSQFYHRTAQYHRTAPDCKHMPWSGCCCGAL